MPGSLYDANNVVVGQAVLWLAPWVASDVEPLIADSEDLFDASAWPSPWLGVGATNEGFKLNVETSTTTIMIEEQTTPVGETIEGTTVVIEAALAEDTLESMKLAWRGSNIVVTAAAAGQPGKRTMSLTDDIKYYTAALETKNKHGLARRIYIPKTSVTGSGEVSFRRAADKRMYPLRVASLSKPSEIQVVDITAPPTS